MPMLSTRVSDSYKEDINPQWYSSRDQLATLWQPPVARGKKCVFLERVVSQCWLCDGWMGEICCKEVAVPKNSLVSAWSLQITSVAHWLHGGCQLVCKHWPTIHLVVMKCENVQCKLKWTTFAFKVKVALHCCNQHMSKGTTFTLKGKVLCFKFVSFIL